MDKISGCAHEWGCVVQKNFGQISENAVEQLQVPRNQRELTFATISLKERCTDWFTWCNSTVMMTNMKRNNILTTLSFWNYPILKKGSPPKKIICCQLFISLHLQRVPELQSWFSFENMCPKAGIVKDPFDWNSTILLFLLFLGQQLMIPVLINPDLLLSQDGCSGRLFVTFTIPLTYTPQL